LSEPASPARLFVYLARDVPRAVVLRRGPSDWARLSVWHTATDAFKHGQWIRGRVYERRSDLSPDGSLFAGFIRQSGGPPRHPAAADTWIAVSRPPYFTAEALWFIGGTYYTGAFFPQSNRLWLGFMEERPPDVGAKPDGLTLAAPRDIHYIDGTGEWTERTVHFNRLLRDGWQLVDKEPYTTLWRRPHPSNGQTLTMLHAFDDFRNFGGPYVVEYTVSAEDGSEHSIGRAMWADWDQQGRLVVARDGEIYSWTRTNGLTRIADFNGQTPEPIPPPA
jgi:hypothetical protein